MIESALLYLGVVIALGGGFWVLEMRVPLKLFTWLPAIVLVYLSAILLSQGGFFAQTAPQTEMYRAAKGWLLPAMLFWMMLRLDLRAFAALGRPLLIAYIGAVLSLVEAAGFFGALSGSWTGGTANMLAVAGAIGLSESRLGPALVVDSLLYTLWVSALLLTVPLAARFDRWSGAAALPRTADTDSTDPLRLQGLILLLLVALPVIYGLRMLAPMLPVLPSATWIVLLATLAGALAGLSPLRRIGGSPKLASFSLYVLIALVGSHATLHGFADVPRYLAAAATVLLFHALLMLLLARRFRLSLFCIGIASLANIGGVASAPILAAAYHRRFVGAAVIMAVTGYLVGTLVGLLVAAGLRSIAA